MFALPLLAVINLEIFGDQSNYLGVGGDGILTCYFYLQR